MTEYKMVVIEYNNRMYIIEHKIVVIEFNNIMYVLICGLKMGDQELLLS